MYFNLKRIFKQSDKYNFLEKYSENYGSFDVSTISSAQMDHERLASTTSDLTTYLKPFFIYLCNA